MENEIWEQLENEPDASYARFLIYKSLGLDRSLEKAYQFYLARNEEKAPKGTKKPQLLDLLLPPQNVSVPGSWKQESREFGWKKRAETWDICELRKTEKVTFAKQVSMIRGFAEKLEEAIKDPRIKPKNFFQLLQGLDVFNRRYTPELARAVLLGDEAEQQQDSSSEESQEGKETTEAN